MWVTPDANGNFVNPTVLINDGANSIIGRSIINDRAVIPQAQEHIPVTENILQHCARALNTLGDGFVEAIDDTTLQAIAKAKQPELSEGRIHGEAIEVPVNRIAWSIPRGPFRLEGPTQQLAFVYWRRLSK